jgi:cell wall-associated NlpC family hydrolase
MSLRHILMVTFLALCAGALAAYATCNLGGDRPRPRQPEGDTAVAVSDDQSDGSIASTHQQTQPPAWNGNGPPPAGTYDRAATTAGFIVEAFFRRARVRVIADDRVRVLSGPGGGLETEASFMEPVILLDAPDADGWAEIELVVQRGYRGFVDAARDTVVLDLSQVPAHVLAGLRVAVVRRHQLEATHPETGAVIRRLPAGSIVPVTATGDEYAEVLVYTGRAVPETLRASRDDLCFIAADNQPPTGVAVIDEAKRLLDQRYLWGGTTFGQVDCSGYVHLVYRLNGLLLKRDAGIQWLDITGTAIPDAAQMLPGDCIFRTGGSTAAAHAGIYLGDNQVIHAKGRDYGVVIEDLDTTSSFPPHARGIKRFCSECATADVSPH